MCLSFASERGAVKNETHRRGKALSVGSAASSPKGRAKIKILSLDVSRNGTQAVPYGIISGVRVGNDLCVVPLHLKKFSNFLHYYIFMS